jgi:nitroreductase
MSNFLDNQNWRYATKKFDATKKISTIDLDFLKEAIRLSSSSFGLQLYKVIIVENPEIKAKLLPASYGQSQIVDSSEVIVFANYANVDASHVDEYINTIAKTREVPAENLSGYGDYMKGSVTSRTSEAIAVWTQKQTYLALGNLLNAAAELKIDTCPMEGFDANQYNEILGLDKLNLNAAVIACIGYRSNEDDNQNLKKVRKSTSDLFITI